MLLAVLPVAFAQSFTLTPPPEPKAGDRVRLEAAWTNAGPTPVRIPADWASRLEVRATWIDPNVPRPRYGGVYGPPRVDAASVVWVAVGPGERVTATVDLATFVPERCHPGCRAGTYEVAASLWEVVYTGAAADQVAVTGSASRDVVVAPVIMRRPLPELMSIAVAPRRAGLTLQAEITLTSRARAPVWVSPDWLGACAWTRGRRGGGATRAAGGQPAWADERGWDRVEPGAAVVLRIPCGGAPWRTAGIAFRVDLAPVSGFLPVDPQYGAFSAEGPLVVGERPR